MPTSPGTAPQGTGDYLSRMDSDGDRRISLLEYQDWLTYAFDGMDRNRDGLLVPEEQPGGRGKAITRAAHRARAWPSASAARTSTAAGFSTRGNSRHRRRDADPAAPALPRWLSRRADFSPLNRFAAPPA